MPLRIVDNKSVYDYADGETVYIFCDGIGEVEGRFDAATGHMFVDGVDWGTPEDWDNLPGCNGICLKDE